MSCGDELLISLYFQMLRIRKVEESIAARYHNQEMRCPVHLSIGQEAVAVGVCQSLSLEDSVFSNHRCHAHFLAKGGNLKAMLAELYGKATGTCKGKGGSMHLVDLESGFMGAAPIVASTIPIAVGAAFGNSMQKKKNITAVFFGDGATEEGVFHESLNFASLKNLPVLFVLENNLYSVYSPLEVRQPKNRSLSDLAKAHGVESFHTDGNDVLAVYETTKRAIELIKAESQPVLLVFNTYRWREHCGPNFDNDAGYRSPEEFERWQEECPVKRLENRLLSHAVMCLEDVDLLQKQIQEEIENAFSFAHASPFPNSIELQSEVYAS